MTTSWDQSRRCLSLEIKNFKRRLDLCAGNNCVQVSYETLSTAACFDKTYLPLSNSAPLTWRVWSCSSSYNFVTKSGNFWITQLVSRLIPLLYDSLQLLYQRRGKQGCRSRGLKANCSKLGSNLFNRQVGYVIWVGQLVANLVERDLAEGGQKTWT